MHTQINSCGLEVSGLMSISDMQTNACNISNTNTLKLSQMTRVKDEGQPEIMEEDQRQQREAQKATTEKVAEMEAESRTWYTT